MYLHFKILIAALLISSIAFGQGTPINVYRAAPTITANDAHLKAYLSLSIPVVVDTAHGLNGALDSLGLIIQIRSTGDWYKRDTFPGGHFWNKVGNAAGGYDSTIMQTIYRSDTAKANLRTAIGGKADTTGGIIRRADTANKWVNRLANNATNDSIIYYIGSTRYAIKDNGGSGSSDSGFSVQQGTLSGIPITKLIIGNKRFIIFDTTAASNTGAIITAARLQQKLDSLNGQKDSVAFNNMITVTGGIAQLGGLAIQHTTFNYRGIYKEIHDSLQNGLFFKFLTNQPTPTSTYMSLMQDTSNWQVYRVKSQTFDSTGASGLTKPWLFLDTVSHNIEVADIPTGPWVKVGNITSTQAATDTVIIGNILYPKGKFNVPGIQNDGALTGKNTVTFGGTDSLQNDSTLITATAAGSFYHKHMVTTINGSSPAYGFGAHMHKWDWTNANISQNVSNYINEFTYRENAANGSTRDFIPNVMYTPSVGTGDSLRSAYAFLVQLSSPVGNLASVGLGHLVGTGNYANVHGAYAVYDDNFTVGGPHETVHSNLAYGVNNLFLNSTGGAHSVLNWTAVDSLKLMRTQLATTGDFLAAYGSDSSIKKLLIGTNLSITGNTLNATSSGGGSQNLRQVLAVGNTANTVIRDSAAIHSDSIITRNEVAHGNLTVGDTTYSTPLIAVANGSSITAGNYGTPWYAQVLSNNFHWALTNQSQVGTSVAPPLANSLYSRISATPYVAASAYWFGDFGVNDTLTNLTTYQNYVVAIIDSLIAHGFVASHIVINSPPFSPARLSDSIYVTPDSLAAAARGCVFVNLLTPMKIAYYAGYTTLLYSDSLHPATPGHAFIGQLDIHALYGIQRTANLIVNGSKKSQDDTVTRNSTIGGTLNPIGGLVNQADNTVIPITAAKALAFGNYGGIEFRADQTTPDTGSHFIWRYVGQATRSNFELVDKKGAAEDTVIRIIGNNTNNDAMVFHGSNVNTGYRYNYNGSSYIAGSLKVTGGYSFGGDNTNSSTKLPLFFGSGNFYGFGNDGSNNLYISNAFAQIQFGGSSGTNGVTFTGHSAFNANATKLFINTMTDNGNGDNLQVSGTIAATQINLTGDGTYRAKAYPLFWNGSNFIGTGIASGTNEVQISNAFGPTSWGTGFAGSFVAKSQFNTSATRLSINTVDDAINALHVNGRVRIDDSLKVPNIARRILDSTNLKLVAVDASGNTWKTDWPTFGSGKANNDSVVSTGYANNGHLYKVNDSMKIVNGAPAWGTYTPTFTNTTNIASSSVTGGGYTKMGNCVHVFIAGTLSTTLGVNTVSTLTISLPGSYSPAASAIDAGHGVIDLQGAVLPNISGVVATTGGSTVTFQFQASSVISSAPFQLSFDYFY